MNSLHFAVVVGINRYPGIGDLAAAHRDASDFFAWVTDPNGGEVPADNAELVLATLAPDASVEDAQPTKERIYAALERRIASVTTVSPQDWTQTRLYFYGAGHGIAPDARDAALLAANATPYHFGRHISCASLLEYFSRVQWFRELALFADCCRKPVEKSVKCMPPEWTHEDKMNGGVRKFLACGAIFNQPAYEEIDGPPDGRRGYFTRALMDGLRGASTARDKATSEVTSISLARYITEHMRRATSRRFRVPLEADYINEGEGEIVFRAPPSESVTAATYPARLEIRSIPVEDLNISAGPGRALVSAKRDPNDACVFECLLPIGLFEAVPICRPPLTPDPAWTFKVTEEGARYAF